MSKTMDDSHVSGLDDSEDYGIAESDNRDRLSELPKQLISQILSLLSVRELVNISLLSKLYYNYNDLWTTDPCLDFRNDSSSLAAFRNFVSGALALWKGSKILRFSISFIFNQCYPRDTSDLDSWLHFAIDNQVEELYLNLADSLDLAYCVNRYKYSPDEYLYSCSSIRKLSIVSCSLYIYGNVLWDQLQSLTIEGGSLSSLEMVKILSGSPRLEVLNLHILETNENLNIQSTSLKILKISRYQKLSEYYCSDRCHPILEIRAPNLETLELLGSLYGSYLLNVPSVTNAVLGIHDYYPCYLMLHHIQYCSEYDLYPMEKIVQVLLSLCHAEKVTLSDWCIEALLLKKKKNSMFLPIFDATFLKICGGAAGEILGILEIFPKLKVLILDLKAALPKLPYDFLYGDLNIVEKPYVNEIDGNIPCSALLHLRTVEITGLVCDTSITPFIAIILQNAHVLEKMVFRVIPFFDRDLFHEAVEKLLSMPRSSPNAEVIIRRLI